MVSGRRDDDGNGLREYDFAHDSREFESEGARGFPLPFVYALDSSTEDFGHVCTVAKRQGENAGGHGINDITKLREPEIDEINLHKQGQSPEEGCVEGCDGKGKSVGREFGNRANDGDSRGDGYGYCGDIDGREESPRDHEPYLLLNEFDAEIEGVEKEEKQGQ